jgi:hypothetical protein
VIERHIIFRDLIHDILHDEEKTDGVETGCGIVLRAKLELITYEPTSCLVCISGNISYERVISALQVVRLLFGMKE